MLKNLAANAGDEGLSPGSGRSSRGGNSNLLECSCLKNPMDRGAWQATVHGVAKSWTELNPAHKPLGRIYTIFSSFTDQIFLTISLFILDTLVGIKASTYSTIFLEYLLKIKFSTISSVQFSCSVVSDSLQTHGLQHARPPCSSPTPGVYSNSCPLSQ